jgi:hypothetical protein
LWDAVDPASAALLRLAHRKLAAELLELPDAPDPEPEESE